MNPARFFAIQTLRIPQGESSGGNPLFTPDVAAHYCQGMPEHWYLSARLKWADDWSGSNKLEYKLWDEAVKLKIKENWRINKKYNGILRRLAGLSLFEAADPKRFKSDDAWKMRAAFIGVERDAWYKTWSARYEAVNSIFNYWADDAWGYIKKQTSVDNFHSIS